MDRAVSAGYVELLAASNFSFLRGASHPEELIETAAALGLSAIALTDLHSLSGAVRAHIAAKEAGIRFIAGARVDPTDGFPLALLPTDRQAYGRLCRLLTLGKRRSSKNECPLTLADVVAHGEGQIALAIPPIVPDTAFVATLERFRKQFPGQAYLVAAMLYRGEDDKRLACLARLAADAGTPLVAANDVYYHAPERRPLQDVVTCIREGCTIIEAGFRLAASAERHLKPPGEMARLFRAYPDAIARTLEIAERCAFSLDEVRFAYPSDPALEGRTPQQELERLTWKGAAGRYPNGLPQSIREQIARELALISELSFAPYFLTVHDIVCFARARSILCQGRGSAANSTVCYCLGITDVAPERITLLFERFVSAERGEPPDIDVDFEHERREEVIQYIYVKYGRRRAAMTATVITYRTRSAIREVGKVLGLDDGAIVALQGAMWRRSREDIRPADIREAGLDPSDPTVRAALALACELRGFPRHLSQHTGGMVLSQEPLDEVAPIANAAMEDRTVIEWDKDDLDALGILKVDILGLGMLTCIAKGLGLIARHHGRSFTISTVPAEDPAVYEMLCRGDSIGVFQVESRAQMTMLPRLQPRKFYDLVIEVAIVRPGPIQGNMVHPYLRRRAGKERVDYPSQELREVLEKTMGVPLFQEQAMRIAVVAAGFTPAEADALRRAMAAFRRTGRIETFRRRFLDGMTARGYDPTFAADCFHQIEGFGEYGFPESHAASFALLVYASAWLKRHYPAAFACALLNSQPMGFYAPAQIVRDARDHGVPVLPPDVNASDWDCTLEDMAGSVGLRIGLRQVKALSEADGRRLVQERVERGHFSSIADLASRAALGRPALEALARADAFAYLGLDRRQALWAARGLSFDPPPLLAALAAQPMREPPAPLPQMAPGEQVAEDYRALALSLRAHPLAFLREQLAEEGFVPCATLGTLAHGMRAQVAGLVIARQQPGSAKGVVFATVEDESGIANLIIWPGVLERFRRAVLGASLLGAVGIVQREGRVIHLAARRLSDFSPRLRALDGPRRTTAPIAPASRDFH